MNQSTTYYFSDEPSARAAQTALQNAGYSGVDVQDGAASGANETFMDKVKEFFGAAPADSDHSGAALLTLSSDDRNARSIVRQFGGQERGDATYADDSTGYASNDGVAEQRLRLHEERLSVDKTQVPQGEFRAHKEVVTERQNIDVPVVHEEVYVERRPVDGEDLSDDASFRDGEEIRIPVMREEVQVQKRPVVAEEIVVGKRRVEETQTVGAEVRKERAHFDSDTDVMESNVTDRRTTQR